ncbi:MAG TPA: DUF1800 domain-containing protein [Gemmatimonadaceae bacterium]|nr:DUF1800 domain-containing protein [Gemmatimonadaceae bacterium]
MPSAERAREPLDEADQARQALDRLTFGARPGDLAAVEHMGVKAWVDLQLNPERIPDHEADSVLDLLDITHKSAFELAADHPQANEYGPGPLQLARQQADTAAMRAKGSGDSISPIAQLAAMRAKADQATQRSDVTLKLGVIRGAANRELAPSILLRASLSNRQLLEVMTDFWENHFSVSAEKVAFPFFLVDYDHAIRAHALGKFRDLLGAVAASPAMLFYLDNYQSSVDSLHPTLFEWQVEQRRAAHPPLGDTTLIHSVKRRRTGLNENYARELMELHTMGVDGGYTQRDVQEVARCLTGWTFDNPLMGGTFAFHPDMHDAGAKTVLGVSIPGGRGIEDGQEVLDILARHPSTARFIAKKLVIHFVSDTAPPALVERAAQTFLRTDGDIREVMRTILTSPEFYSRSAYRAKVKTPFELVASILRVMNAVPDTTQQTLQILTRLEQPMFGRQTPDGWPDQGAAWMNMGALLNRVNLGAQVAANQVPGISIAKWKPAQQLTAMSAEQAVDAVIQVVLDGDTSPATRDALLGVHPPAGPASQAQQLAYIGNLVGVALGSSDFQHR